MATGTFTVLSSFKLGANASIVTKPQLEFSSKTVQAHGSLYLCCVQAGYNDTCGLHALQVVHRTRTHSRVVRFWALAFSEGRESQVTQPASVLTAVASHINDCI